MIPRAVCDSGRGNAAMLQDISSYRDLHLWQLPMCSEMCSQGSGTLLQRELDYRRDVSPLQDGGGTVYFYDSTGAPVTNDTMTSPFNNPQTVVLPNVGARCVMLLLTCIAHASHAQFTMSRTPALVHSIILRRLPAWISGYYRQRTYYSSKPWTCSLVTCLMVAHA